MTTATMTRTEFRAILAAIDDLPEDEADEALHTAIMDAANT